MSDNRHSIKLNLNKGKTAPCREALLGSNGLGSPSSGSIPASAQRYPRTSQRFYLAIGGSHLQRIQTICWRDRMSVVVGYCLRISIGRPASEAGGRAFESRPGHHLISRSYASRSCERCASKHRTRPNQFERRSTSFHWTERGRIAPSARWLHRVRCCFA